MFNGKLKNEAVIAYEKAYNVHELSMRIVVKSAERLQVNKQKFKITIDNSWSYLNSMKNTPHELVLQIENIKIEFKKFENAIDKIQHELDKDLKTSTGLGAVGIAAGAGVATFGPSAAMAIAMTFGTASTGTAISTLSGAAATNAALAWLGGGAIVAGGGGISTGSAFLALAGPVGWAIGGTALVGAGLFARSKNKKVADESYSKAIEIEQHTRILKATDKEIRETSNLVMKTNRELHDLCVSIQNLTSSYNHDVKQFANNLQLLAQLQALINNTLSAAKLLNRPIGAEG